MIAYSISWDDEIKILQRTALYYFNFILNWLNRSAWLTKTTTCSLYKKIYTKRNIFSLQLIWDYEVIFLQRKALILFYTNCYIVQLDHKDKKNSIFSICKTMSQRLLAIRLLENRFWEAIRAIPKLKKTMFQYILIKIK